MKHFIRFIKYHLKDYSIMECRSNIHIASNGKTVYIIAPLSRYEPDEKNYVPLLFPDVPLTQSNAPAVPYCLALPDGVWRMNKMTPIKMKVPNDPLPVKPCSPSCTTCQFGGYAVKNI